MKTAISLPDNLYKKADATAAELGIPRSQLVAKALEEFIQRRENITEKLDQVYGGIPDGRTPEILEADLVSLRKLTKDDSW